MKLKSLLTTLAAAVGLTTAATAATPVAVWSGDFKTTTKGDFALSANGNTVADDGSIITIGSDKKGVLIDWNAAATTEAGFKNKKYTVLVRYANLPAAGNIQLLSTFFSGTTGSETTAAYLDRVGFLADKKGVSPAHKSYGVWQAALRNVGQTRNGVPCETSETTKYMAITYDPSSAGYAAYFKTTTDGEFSAVYTDKDLKAGSENVYGVAIGGPRLVQTWPAATGMKIQGIAIFNSVLTTDEMAAYEWPVTITDARWGNIGDADNGGLATAVNQMGEVSAFTVSLADLTGIGTRQIGTEGTLLLKKVRLVSRNNSSYPTKITVTPNGGTAVETSTYTSGSADGFVYKSDRSKIESTTSRKYMDFTFDTPVEIDTSKTFTLQVHGAGMSCVQPKNPTMYYGGYEWSPAVEFIGDYTFVGSKPKYFLNYYDVINNRTVEGWLNFTCYSPAVAAQTTNGISFAINKISDSTNYRNDSGCVAISTVDFSFAGTYADVYGVEHSSIYEEMRSSLATTLPINDNIFKSGIVHGANANGTAVASGLDASTTYVMYFGFGVYRSGADASGFKLDSANCGKITSLDYVVSKANSSSSWPTTASTSYTSFSAGQSVCADKTGLLLVRAVLKPKSDGTVSVTLPGGRSGMSFVAIAEVPEKNNSYEATVTGNTNFSDIEWTPAKPDGGFASDAELIINNTAAAEVTMDETVAVDSLTANNGAELALTIKNASSLTVNTLTAGDDSSLIVSGVPGTVDNLTVAGAVTFNDALTFASGKALTVNGTLTGGFIFESGSSLSFGTSGALVVPSGKVVDWKANIANAKHRELLAKTSGDGTLKMAVSGNPELQIHSDTTAHTANVNVEYIGTCEIHFVGSDRANVDKYTVSEGKTVKFENGTIWPKRTVFYVDGTLIAKYFKLGHEANGAYTGKITVNNGGYVKTQKVTFTNKGGSSGLDIKTGGVFEFLQNDESAIALAASDKTYSVVLNGGTLKADTSSWHLDSTIAMTIGADSIISAAEGKTITIAGVISGSGNVSVTGAGTVKLTGANTDTGTYTVASGASLTLGNSRTMTIDGASAGTITVTLTSEEKTSLDEGKSVQLIGVSGETFAGTLKTLDSTGAAYEIETPTISEGKLVITKKAGAKVSPFNLTTPPEMGYWTGNDQWTDSSTPAQDVESADWANKVSANIEIAQDKETSLFLDSDQPITLGTLDITNAGTLSIDDYAGGGTLTADEIVIDNTGTLQIYGIAEGAITVGLLDIANLGTVTLTNNVVVSGTIDDSDSTGATTIAFAPGAAAVTAGANTILNTAGTGTYTIGADKKLTVKSGSLTVSQVSGNAGTLNFDGGTAETPISVTGGSYLGVVTLGANTYVVNDDKGSACKYVVTGSGATSFYTIARNGTGNPGMANGTPKPNSFSNVILCSQSSGGDLWIEHGAFDANGTVGLNVTGNIKLSDLDTPIVVRSVSGDKSLSGQNFTIKCTEDANFAGTSSQAITIDAGTAVQTFSGAYTGALTVNENATVKLAGSANPSSIAVEGTVYFSCTTDKTYANAITGTGNIIVNNDGETGAMKFTGDLSGFTGTITYKGGSYDIGTMRTYSVPSYITLESGVTIKATQTAAEYAQGIASAFTGFTEGQTITLKKLDGASEGLTVDAEGKASSTASGEVHIDGAATYADATFTNATSSGGYHIGTLAYKAYSGLKLQYDTAVTTNAAGTGAYLKHHPWIEGFPNSFFDGGDLTIAVVGEMSPSNNTTFVHLGNSNSGLTGVLLATGSKDDEVVVKVNTGTSLEEVTTMTVPHAATARHVYIITKTDTDTQSIFSVYLDGTPWKTVKLSKKSFSGGVQCGSDFGGQLRNNNIVKAVTSDDTALINVLRVYDRVISKAEINAYSSAYPYVSDSGTSSRTFTAAAENWVGAEDAKLWSFKQTATSEAVLTNAPVGTSAIKIDGTEDVTTTISVNLDADEHADSVAISSPGAFKFAKVEGKAGLIVSGQTTIGCPVEIEYKSLDISGAPLTLIDEGAIEFDLKNVDLSTYFEDAMILLTGDVEQNDEKITCKGLTQVAGRTATFGYNGTQYVLTITVDTSAPFIYTITGWTWHDLPVSAEVVSNVTTMAITVKSDLEWNIDRSTFTVDSGTLKATKAGTATITVNEGGTFDVNGLGSSLYSVVLNGGSLVNTGTDIGDSKQVTSIALGENSTVGGTGGFSVQGTAAGQYSRTSIDLGEHTLTKTGDNAFALVNTDIDGTGTLYVEQGILNSTEETVFTNGTLKIGANGTVKNRAGKTLKVATVIGEGGTLENNGTVTAFTLSGTLAIANSGSFGTITLANGAVLNVGNKRNLTLAGTGTVNVQLTEAEGKRGTVTTLFTPDEGASITVGTVKDKDGNVMSSDTYTISDGKITIKKHPFMFIVK